MVEKNEQTLEEQNIVPPAAEPTPATPPVAETPPASGLGADFEDRLLEKLSRVVQSETDKRIARLRKEMEQRPSVGQVPTPTPDEVYAQQLLGAGWTPQQVQALQGNVQGQYAAYQGQAQMAQVQQQLAELNRMQTVQKRCSEEGIDPADPDLDVSDPTSLERSISKIAVRRAKEEASAQVKAIRDAQAKAETERKKALVDSGALDTLSGGERVGSSGDVVGRMAQASADFNSGKDSLATYQRKMAELERQA